MSLIIDGIDRTDKLVVQGERTANIDTVFGRLAQIREFQLCDNSLDSMSPFDPSGAFSKVDTRNKTVKIFDSSKQVSFYGNIKKYSAKWGKSGWNTKIKASEAMAVLFKFIVEENDKTTHSGFLVNTIHSIGTQTITIDTGSTVIPDNALVTFSDDLVPRYQVQKTVGSPTTSITLDRPLEIPISDNQTIIVSIPKIDTISNAIKNLLQIIGMTDLIGTTFDKFSNLDSSYKVNLNVTLPDNINLKDHLAKLLELGNFNLLISTSGQINIRRGWQWNEGTTTNYISENEIMHPVEIEKDDTLLVIGSETIYKSGATVKIYSIEVDPSYIEYYHGVARWQPILTKSGSSLVKDYPYLYADQSSAEFFAIDYLEENKATRKIYKCNLKGSYALIDSPVNIQQGLKKIALEIGKNYSLTSKFSKRFTRYDEPVAVKSYTYNEALNRYTNVELILTNYKNIPRINYLQKILIIGSWGIFKGVVVTMKRVYSAVIYLEIFDSNQNFIQKQAYSRLNSKITDEAGIHDYIQFTLDTIVNGLTYYYKLSIRSGNNYSTSTMTEFIPKTNPANAGDIGAGVFTMP